MIQQILTFSCQTEPEKCLMSKAGFSPAHLPIFAQYML